MGGRPPQVPDPAQARPAPTAQRNFTAPGSCITTGGASKGFEHAYNVPVLVASTIPVIMAAARTQEAKDKRQLWPILEKVKENCAWLGEKACADARDFDTEHLTERNAPPVDLYVPPDRQKHGSAPETTAGTAAPLRRERGRPDAAQVADGGGGAVYTWREAVVRPVLGQTE